MSNQIILELYLSAFKSKRGRLLTISGFQIYVSFFLVSYSEIANLDQIFFDASAHNHWRTGNAAIIKQNYYFSAPFLLHLIEKLQQ